MLNLNVNDLNRIVDALQNSIVELHKQNRSDDILAAQSTIEKLRLVQDACSESTDDHYVALSVNGNMQNLGLYPDMTTALESPEADSTVWVADRNTAQRWALDLLELVGTPTN